MQYINILCVIIYIIHNITLIYIVHFIYIKWNYDTQVDSTYPKRHRLANKTPVPGMENLSSNCWSGGFKRLPKLFRLLSSPLATSQNLKVRLYS